MNSEISKLHKQTGLAWDAIAKKYEREVEKDVEFLRKGGNSLLEPEREILGDLSSWCKRAIHLQCAGGKDTLSLLAQGAQEVIGNDISSKILASAKKRSEQLNANASWICCDVLDMPTSLNSTADLVYTGRGALPWVLDLKAWVDVVSRLLKQGGRLFIFEGHPLDWVWDSEASDLRFHPQRNNYFSETLEGGERWPAPLIAQQSDQSLNDTLIHERQWTLAQIINEILNAGFKLKHFGEYPIQYWNHFSNMPKDMLHRLPHTFSILAEKD